MVSSRSKSKPEPKQTSPTPLKANSSNGAAQKRKKRKDQPEEKADQTPTPSSGGALTPNVVSATPAPAAKGGEHTQGGVSGRNLSEEGAIAAAIEHLKGCDSKLKDVIETSKLPGFQICTSPFRALARGIVCQQLATHAGTAVFNRLLALCGGESTCTPAAVLQLSAPTLRGIGVSARKAGYLHDLSRHYIEGHLSDDAIEHMEDEKLITALTAVKGIGVWSVHTFMIFSLHRPDVLPVGDQGVRKAVAKLYGLTHEPDQAEMERLTAPWRPYRSLGAWYMLRLKENESKAAGGRADE